MWQHYLGVHLNTFDKFTDFSLPFSLEYLIVDAEFLYLSQNLNVQGVRKPKVIYYFTEHSRKRTTNETLFIFITTNLLQIHSSASKCSHLFNLSVLNRHLNRMRKAGSDGDELNRTGKQVTVTCSHERNLTLPWIKPSCEDNCGNGFRM